MPDPVDPRLDAINQMLMAVRNRPVSAVDDGSNPNAGMALAQLDYARTRVLSEGWAANTFDKMTLSPNTDGIIEVPANTISATLVGCDTRKVSLRNGRLFNLTDNTDVWDEPVEVRLVVDLDFADLPPILRAYITEKAIGVFYRNVKGEKNRDHQMAEDIARADAKAEDMRVTKPNVFRDNLDARQIAGRRFNPARRY